MLALEKVGELLPPLPGGAAGTAAKALTKNGVIHNISDSRMAVILFICFIIIPSFGNMLLFSVYKFSISLFLRFSTVPGDVSADIHNLSEGVHKVQITVTKKETEKVETFSVPFLQLRVTRANAKNCKL